METLDDNREYIDPSSVSIWPTVLKYGGIMGLVSIAFALVTFIMGMGSMTTTILVSLASIVVSILILRAAIKYFRDEELGGYITLGKVVKLGVPMILLSSVIGLAFQYIYINFIDPTVVDQMVEAQIAMVEGFGTELPEETLEEMERATRDSMSPAKMLMNGLGGGLIGGLIISAIAGAIMKREAPIV